MHLLLSMKTPAMYCKLRDCRSKLLSTWSFPFLNLSRYKDRLTVSWCSRLLCAGQDAIFVRVNSVQYRFYHPCSHAQEANRSIQLSRVRSIFVHVHPTRFEADDAAGVGLPIAKRKNKYTCSIAVAVPLLLLDHRGKGCVFVSDDDGGNVNSASPCGLKPTGRRLPPCLTLLISDSETY